ncbi:actin-like ATPase domain-containing protein [Polychaeton citri CBS 116435]|uniref:Actin-like ATPase domain-containing protein n=1 Tax=Polychaeton citri CBS 116435 TaxID=1314669 RepID=A0A9P4Q5K6_9PEZI|nr:actin-like ATPase domain-containing protein [Polychaeton citri CBS 116435]
MFALDRRRNGAITPLVVCLTVFALLVSTANAASSVLGIDFGTLNFKAALVKPGIPLEIVLTKDSKRKETAAVAFKPPRDKSGKIIAEAGTFPERIYGSDALALQGRMPGEVFPNLKPLLGLPWTQKASEVVEWYQSRYPALQLKQVMEMGTMVIQSESFVDGEMPWSVEELLAMELANVKVNAENMAGKGTVVEDAVISVPAFYTADERRAIERAAHLAGLNVMSLVSDGLAVGLDYAKSRSFPSISEGGKPEYHIVFDMGAGSTTASVLRMQSRSVKDVGRFNKTVQEVAVLGNGWDRTLGGDAMNQLIAEDFIRKFSTKPVLKNRGIGIDEIASNARLMSRIWKEAEKVRQVLSANTQTSSSFEELLPEVDFKTKLSRAAFEELVEPFAERVAGPITDALAAAKLSMADIDSIILHGGVIRTPFVQKKLEELAGSAKLRTNVNADESAVFGAAFKGAGLSPSFKVKEIRDSDVAAYPAGITYTDSTSGKERRQSLFSATSPVGNGATTKQITLKDKEDFVFYFYQTIGDVDRSIYKVQTENITAGVKELKEKFGCEKEDVTTRLAIKLNAVNSLPEVIGGTLSCETESEARSVGDSVKDWLGFGKKKGEQEPLDDDNDAAGTTDSIDADTATGSKEGQSTSTSSASASSSSTKTADKPKKTTESINIAFSISFQGNPQPGYMEMQRMRERLAAFDASDKARYAREEALNLLESYTYFVRDFLGNEDYETVSTEVQRNDISQLLEETRGFMESSQILKATKDVLVAKRDALRKLVEPIQSRRKQSLSRPEKVQTLQESLDQAKKMLEEMMQSIAKASSQSEEASKSAAASASSSSETSSATGPTEPDDDLEEPDTSSVTAAPRPTDTIFSPYTDDDLAGLEAVYESVAAWLKEKEAAQAKLQPYDEPTLLVKDIEAKAKQLSTSMTELIYKKIQKQRASSSNKAKATKTKSKKSSKTKTTSGTETATDAESTPVKADGKQKGSKRDPKASGKTRPTEKHDEL